MNNILGMFGLCFRAGKLAVGDDAVFEAAQSGRCRAVFLAKDAGKSAVRQSEFLKKNQKFPVLATPFTKEELGQALGRRTCAACAVTDSGFAASISRKITEAYGMHPEETERLRRQEERFAQRKRRGHKKNKAESQVTIIEIEEEAYERLYGTNQRKQKKDGGEC